MPRRLTAEERYERLLNNAWWRFQRGDVMQMRSIHRLLERAADQLSAAINRQAAPDGSLSVTDMEAIKVQIDRAMTEFRNGYEYEVDRALGLTLDTAIRTQTEALDVYLGEEGTRLSLEFQAHLNSQQQELFDEAHERAMGGLRLSDRIWRLDMATRATLERDVLNSILQGRSAATLARRAERYLLPERVLPKDVPSSVYSGQPSDVSYNAWRMARTEINQTWHQVRDRADDDLGGMGIALGTRWVLSKAHATRMRAATKGRTSRDICDEWAERMPGTAILDGQPYVHPATERRMLERLEEYNIDPHGVYVPGKAPIDHPNGLCTTHTVLTPREVLMAQLGFDLGRG